MRKKKYVPKKHLNPIIQSKKIEKLGEDIELHRKNIDTISKSYDHHITMLSNFARHDIKNSVQSMDSILSTNTKEELTDEHIKSLNLNIKIIRETVENFTKLVPYSEKSNFKIEQLITAIELLNREIFYERNIVFKKELPEISFSFDLPFQSVVQMVNNLILNSVKAFESCEIEQKIIKMVVELKDDMFYLNIFDNASKIEPENPDVIFEYGFSTTGGSGIGLYHARYLCSLYKGDVKLICLEEKDNFTKCFSINLPTIE